jgi:SAM-dependent methyltransferase
MNEFRYVGSELALFSTAHNWKSYWSRQIAEFLAGDVLEVGAGIGTNTQILKQHGTGRWVCLEPDPQLVAQLVEAFKDTPHGRRYEPICGTLQALGDQQFDTVIYIDVLEHIDDDYAELKRAASLVRPGGHIIVLSPAHQWLFSPFDAAIGHYRRYNRSMLRDISPEGLTIRRLRYLDSCGLIASASNLLFLKQSMPTKLQLKLWDSFIVPISRILDPLVLYGIGKSILAVWCKPSTSRGLEHASKFGSRK